MKNFDWTSFTRKIAIKSTLSQIYDAWAIPGEMEKWFLSKADYFDSNKKQVNKDAAIKKDYTYSWSWYLYDIIENGKVTEANGLDFMQFTFAGECLVDVKLSMLEEYVIVELTQKNIPTDEDSKKNIRLGCDNGWSFFLVNLKSIYEGGLDLRNKNPKLKVMLNN